jgi:adenylate cyclase
VLFSDIRGFTSYCDQKEPAVVVQDLNAYLTGMVEIIVRYGGEVNKFIGDGILAVFSDFDAGARPGDHAERAVRCGLEMVQAPGRFRTGVGVHTGEVVMGNVGSIDKLENTVLGATVNVAARLEGLNKELGSRMLLSEETSRRLDGSIALTDLGPARVRGAATAVRVFTPGSLAPAAVEAPSGAGQSVV